MVLACFLYGFGLFSLCFWLVFSMVLAWLFMVMSIVPAPCFIVLSCFSLVLLLCWLDVAIVLACLASFFMFVSLLLACFSFSCLWCCLGFVMFFTVSR